MTDVEPAIPSTFGRFVSMRPMQQADVPWLLSLATLPETIHRWRLRGRTPSPNIFPSGLAQSTLLQYVIERRDSNERVGLIDAYNVNLVQQTAFASIIIDPKRQRSGWPMEGGLIFLNMLFCVWDFRKVYFEGMDFCMSHLSALKIARHEGSLSEHEPYGSRYVDWSVYAIYRRDWLESGYDRLLRPTS